MRYRIQTFYPPAKGFVNTNHESDDLEELKRLARSETFAGFRIRIVDERDGLRFAPPIRERKENPTVEDIAKMLDVAMLPPIFLNPDESDEDEGTMPDESWQTTPGLRLACFWLLLARRGCTLRSPTTESHVWEWKS
jgi:hypothetical protein